MSWLEALGVFRRPPDARSAVEIEADVRAEIEHHLVCKERELVAAGRTAEQAQAEALERFGDPASAREACVRIQTGERIMLQRIHFVVTVLLLVAVLVLAWSTNRSSQAARAGRMPFNCATPRARPLQPHWGNRNEGNKNRHWLCIARGDRDARCAADVARDPSL